MTLFEFVTVIISMVLALATGQLLAGLAALAKNRGRVRPFTPFFLWAFQLFTLPINLWWSQWDFRDLNWTFPTFWYVLLGPTILFFAVSLFLPDDPGGREIDLERHYWSVRPVFFAVLLGYVGLTWLDGPLLAGDHLFGNVGRLNAVLVGCIVASLLTTHRRVHLVASVVAAAVFPFLLLYRFIPGVGA